MKSRGIERKLIMHWHEQKGGKVDAVRGHYYPFCITEGRKLIVEKHKILHMHDRTERSPGKKKFLLTQL